MEKPLCYLAGPIAGVDYDVAVDWREYATERLTARGIECLSPMRAKHALKGKRISRDYKKYQDHGQSYTASGIMTRDHTDILRADALLVNLLRTTVADLSTELPNSGTWLPSLGTVMELAWAYAYRKPAVVAMEASGNPHGSHPMLAAAMPFRLETLDQAIDTVAIVLNR